MRFIIAATLFFLAQLSWSASPFHQHLQSTAQSLSAFYMYQLTEGDEKHLREFTKYRQDANQALENCTEPQKALFLSRWNKLQQDWEFDNVAGVGLNLVRRVRLNLREYMTEAYLYSTELPNELNGVAAKIQDIQLLTAIMSARTMDVASSHLGSQSLTKHDLQIQSKNLAKIVQQRLARLSKMKLSKEQTLTLRKVKTQFDFVEDSLVDHNKVAPYFLVYRNVIRLGKLLDKQVAGF